MCPTKPKTFTNRPFTGQVSNPRHSRPMIRIVSDFSIRNNTNQNTMEQYLAERQKKSEPRILYTAQK